MGREVIQKREAAQHDWFQKSQKVIPYCSHLWDINTYAIDQQRVTNIGQSENRLFGEHAAQGLHELFDIDRNGFAI